jgi:hypothetical protein
VNDDDNDMGGNFSRDVFTVSVIAFGGPCLLIAIALAAWFWSAS